VVASREAHGDSLIGAAGFVAGILGVAHEVDQDLHHLVLVRGNHRPGLIVRTRSISCRASELELMRRESSIKSGRATLSTTPEVRA